MLTDAGTAMMSASRSTWVAIHQSFQAANGGIGWKRSRSEARTISEPALTQLKLSIRPRKRPDGAGAIPFTDVERFVHDVALAVDDRHVAVDDPGLGMGDERLGQGTNAPLCPRVIGIEEGDELAARGGDAGVRRRVQSAVIAADDANRVAEAGEHLRCGVGRAVVDRDHLQPRPVLVERAAYGGRARGPRS